MSLALDLFSLAAIGAGVFFFFAGTVGLLRFPDSLTRLHALTKADNLGLGLVVLGLLPRAGSLLDALRLDRHLGPRAAFRRRDRATDRARAPPAESGRVSVLQALDLGLAVLVLAVAAWTIAARELFSAVVGYVAYGLLLAIVWVRLYAPDVALTEAAIGSGVTGVLLVTSGARLGARATPERRRAAGPLPAVPGRRSRAPRRGGACGRRADPPRSGPLARARGAARGSPRPVSAIRSPPS